MEDFQIRLNLKSKEDGRLLSVYPPIAAEKNGLNRWPVDTSEWEIVSVERGTGIRIPDVLERNWVAYEGDKITLYSYTPKDFIIKFQDGMFGIEVDRETWVKDFVNTFESGVFINYQIREYHQQQFTLQQVSDRDENFFIPLAHLNIGGTINGENAIILTKQKQ